MIREEIRAANDSVAFIEKAYRKKDPEYAGFSIQQQQLLLGRLEEEWTKSECGKPPPTPMKNVSLPVHPTNSTTARKGLRKCEMIRAEIRAGNDSIVFIERTYRKKDREYADFSILQQQQDLQRLAKEWSEFGCAGPSPTPEKKAGK